MAGARCQETCLICFALNDANCTLLLAVGMEEAGTSAAAAAAAEATAAAKAAAAKVAGKASAGAGAAGGSRRVTRASKRRQNGGDPETVAMEEAAGFWQCRWVRLAGSCPGVALSGAVLLCMLQLKALWLPVPC
jgi:hypothetical protein